MCETSQRRALSGAVVLALLVGLFLLSDSQPDVSERNGREGVAGSAGGSDGEPVPSGVEPLSAVRANPERGSGTPRPWREKGTREPSKNSVGSGQGHRCFRGVRGGP